MIIFNRECTESSLVRDFATFHIFFGLNHIPEQVWSHWHQYHQQYNHQHTCHYHYHFSNQIPHWQSLLSKGQNCDVSEEGEQYRFISICSYDHWTLLSWQEVFDQLRTWHPGDGEPNSMRSNATTIATETGTETSPHETGSYKRQNGLDYPVNVARWGNIDPQMEQNRKLFPLSGM